MLPQSLIQHYQKRLQTLTPHRAWHLLPMSIVPMVLLLVIMRAYVLRDITPTIIAVSGVMIIYWCYQFYFVVIAQALAQDSAPLPDDVVGVVSSHRRAWAQLYAIIRHHLTVIIGLSLAFFGTAMIICFYLWYRALFHGYGWQHPPIDFSLPQPGNPLYDNFFTVSQDFSLYPTAFLWMIAGYLVLMTVNSMLSVAIGIGTRLLRHALLIYIVLLTGAIILTFWLIVTGFSNGHDILKACGDFTDTGITISYHMQGLAWSMLDGGIDITKSFHMCYDAQLDPGLLPYSIRTVLHITLIALAKFWLISVLLRRSASLHQKRKSTRDDPAH